MRNKKQEVFINRKSECSAFAVEKYQFLVRFFMHSNDKQVSGTFHRRFLSGKLYCFTRLKNSVEKHNKSELIVVPASFFHFTLNLLEIERNESDSYIFHDSISFSSLH